MVFGGNPSSGYNITELGDLLEPEQLSAEPRPLSSNGEYLYVPGRAERPDASMKFSSASSQINQTSATSWREGLEQQTQANEGATKSNFHSEPNKNEEALTGDNTLTLQAQKRFSCLFKWLKKIPKS